MENFKTPGKEEIMVWILLLKNTYPKAFIIW